MKLNPLPNKMLIFKTIFFLFLFLNSYSHSFSAQTGKLAGTITDSSGQPIIGAHIVLEDGKSGTATNLDGDYYFIGITPGFYKLTISAIGYTKVQIENVIISSDHTTYINQSLKEESFELEVVVYNYERPVVELQETSQRISIDGQTVRQLPMSQADDMVSYQAGASMDASGEIHIRGGRSGEIGYYVDGVRVEDPIDGSSSTNIGREALQELQILSGTFNAEYGEAMSGIVNIITREGKENYDWSIEYTSPMVNSSPYRETDWVRNGSDAVRDTLTGKSLYSEKDMTGSLDPLIPVQGRWSTTLSGPVKYLNKTTFFIHGLHTAYNSHLPFGDKYIRRLTGKFVNNSNLGKVALSYGFRKSNKQSYNHKWKYIPEHYHRKFESNNFFSFMWTKNISEAIFYEFTAGFNGRQLDAKLFEDWSDYLNSDYQKEDFTFQQYFYDEEDWSDTWRESSSETISISNRFTWQMDKNHQWRAGFDGNIQEIELTDIRELEIGENGSRKGLIDYYKKEPLEIAAFIHDKIELDYLIVNAGLRLDYIDPNSDGWSNVENPLSGLETVEPSFQLSPRLGLAHPVSEKTSLYFAYGHFFQFPDYTNLFINSADLNPDTLANRTFDMVGNPALKPQKTVAYEVGIKGLFNDDLGYTATAFYKDITDLVGTRQIRYGTAYNYAAFVNVDYASVAGFEIGLNRKMSRFWSLQANYTYSVAKGNSSEPTTGYWDAYTGTPEVRQEYYMDFDRRHVANFILTWNSSESNYPEIFNTSALKGVNAGVIFNYSSGLPYTPYTDAGEQLAIRNSERMDATLRVDLRLAKTLMFKPVRVELFTSIENLFDRINPLYVNSRTGEPWETTIAGNEVTFDQVHNPSNVDIPRIVKIGLQVRR